MRSRFLRGQSRLILLLIAVALLPYCFNLSVRRVILQHLRVPLFQSPPITTCQSSSIAIGDWLQWPHREPNQYVDPNIFPPAGLNLPALRLAGRQPPNPVKAWYPVPALPPVISPPTKLLIIVKSAPQNAGARRAIRETWGNPSYWPPDYLIRFIVGSPASPRLLAEAAEFGDIIVHGDGDGYRNNTRKLLAGFAWAVKYLPSLRLLLCVDDDLLLNPFASLPLFQSAEAAAASPGEDGQLIAGHLIEWARPVRSSDREATPEIKKKWAVPERMYAANRYPDYLSAGWLLLSARLLPELLWAAGFVTPRLPIDDVYVGLLAVKLRLSLVSLSDLLALETDLLLEDKPPELLLARHGYSGDLASLRGDWERLVALHCDVQDGSSSSSRAVYLTATQLANRGAKVAREKRMEREANGEKLATFVGLI